MMNHATGCVYQTKEFDLDATIRQDPYEFSCTVRVEESGAELDQIDHPEFIGEATVTITKTHLCYKLLPINEPRSEKTGLRGFRPGPTQTGLYSHRRLLEASNFGFRK